MKTTTNDVNIFLDLLEKGCILHYKLDQKSQYITIINVFKEDNIKYNKHILFFIEHSNFTSRLISKTNHVSLEDLKAFIRLKETVLLTKDGLPLMSYSKN